MPLILRPTNGFVARDQFSVFKGNRYVGRIYKTEKDDWFWGLEWFAAGHGEKLVRDFAPTREEALAQFKAAWEGLNREE